MTSYSKRNDVTKGRTSRKERTLKNLKEQMHDVDLWRSAAAEFLAIFIFIFIVSITYMMPGFPEVIVGDAIDGRSSNLRESAYSGDTLQISVGIALTYATLIQCFENISGGYMNPAISVAMVIAGHISAFKAVIFSIAQITGAFSAAALCFGMIRNPTDQLRSVSQVHERLTSLQGFGLEVLQTLIVTVTWLATYITSKNHLGSSALPVGIAYLSNCLWAGHLTGSSTNPARSLAPAVLAQYWKNLWVYIAGPLTGSVVGALLYAHVFVTTPKKKRNKLLDSGRTAEGESEQSEHDVNELTPFSLSNQSQTTTFSNAIGDTTSQRRLLEEGIQPANNRICFHRATSDASEDNYMQRRTSNLVAPQAASSQYIAPRGKIPQHQNAASSTRRLAPSLQALHHVASTAPNSTNVTLTRERRVSRPSTACGALMTSSVRTKSSMDGVGHVLNHAVAPIGGYRSMSASEPFSEGSKSLLNNSAL